MAKRPPTLKDHVVFMVVFLALLWVIEGVDSLVFDGGLERWGIQPRTASGVCREG